MRVSLLLSVVVVGIFPLVACEFHAGTNDPPAAPTATTTPAATTTPTVAAAPTAPPVPTTKVLIQTGGVHLQPSDAGAP